MVTLLLSDTTEDILKAAEIIKRGGLVGFPTETVYGLGADALNAEAVGKVYAAKGRPSDNPMIVHISSCGELNSLTPEVTEDMRTLMDAFWPGPMTMVVKRSPGIPDVTTGGLDTVGVRLPSNRTARELIRLSGLPIAAPSANISGRPSPTTAEHVIHDLSGRIDAVIVGGDSDIGIESSVIDMTGDVPMILRPGAITKEMFSQALGKEVLLDPSLARSVSGASDQAAARDCASGPGSFRPRSPGMKYRHYAPKAAMTVFEGAPEDVRRAMREEAERLCAAGKKVAIIDFSQGSEFARGSNIATDPGAAQGEGATHVSADAKLLSVEQRAAHDLFARLRRADEEGADAILSGALPEEGLGFSVMNRMLRSAGYNIRKV